MVKEIPLTQGYVALVDDSDYEFLMRFKWSVAYDANNIPRYARHGMSVNGKFYSITMHRLIAAAPDGLHVDHWDGNGFNNQRENLRLATHSQNQQNRRPLNKLKGVTRQGQRAWKAQITHEGAFLFLGSHRTATDAAKVYDAAAKRLFGEFACTNFPEIDPAADAIAAAVIAGHKPPRPERLPRKLTDADAIAIRQAYERGEATGIELAQRYGVCAATVYHLLRGRTFAHLPGADLNDKRRARAAEESRAA